MFDLKKYQRTLKNGVLGVSGVPDQQESDSVRVAVNNNCHTKHDFMVCHRVPCPDHGTQSTPELPHGCAEIENRNPLLNQGFRLGEHSEHREHQNTEHLPKTIRLHRSLQQLGKHLNIPESRLVEGYFTRADLDDIARGIYDTKLADLANLIRTDSSFPFIEND